MSKLKAVMTIVVMVAIAALAALGVSKIEVNALVDIGLGIGGVVAAIIAIFKK